MQTDGGRWEGQWLPTLMQSEVDVPDPSRVQLQLAGKGQSQGL